MGRTRTATVKLLISLLSRILSSSSLHLLWLRGVGANDTVDLVWHSGVLVAAALSPYAQPVELKNKRFAGTARGVLTGVFLNTLGRGVVTVDSGFDNDEGVVKLLMVVVDLLFNWNFCIFDRIGDEANAVFKISSSCLRVSRKSHDDICFFNNTFASDGLLDFVAPNVFRVGVIVVVATLPDTFVLAVPHALLYFKLTGVFREDIIH